MKKILGLDLGTTSIGWAVVNEAETEGERSSIIKLGVRVNPLSTDEKNDFNNGKSISTTAERTLNRSMRRNLQRYKLRRKNLIDVLTDNNIISDHTILYETGNRTTFETLELRAKAAEEEITLDQFARVLLMINKKRGYKSNRKFKSAEEDGLVIDSISVADVLYENDWTPGQYGHDLTSRNKMTLPDFYKSDLLSELSKVWGYQKQFYPGILTDDLFNNIQGLNKTQTWAACRIPFGIVGIKRATKGKELVKENYLWRSEALEKQLGLEELAIVLQEINGQIKSSSGYLGNISDRSKELHMGRITVGQYLIKLLHENPNISLKNRVFYRQDYMDEFERVWSVQSTYHKELTEELKKEIRDIVIFYQRRLKSQKGLISFCEFESYKKTVLIDGVEKNITIGPRVCPKSSPLFQEFRIWQVLNNLRIDDAELSLEQKQILADELKFKKELKVTDVCKFLGLKGKFHKMNYEKIEGNRTMYSIVDAVAQIIAVSGHGEFDFSKMRSDEIQGTIRELFGAFGWNAGIIDFDTDLSTENLENQPMFRLWHMLYSYEGDDSRSGNQKLSEKIVEHFNFDEESAKILANVTFEPDYANLSSKAIRKILPFLKEGKEYSEACMLAGYRHSKSSLTKEEIISKEYVDRLEQLPKNSLRNPVVEKILNQMTNVVNDIIEEYGRPDEIRIEMARELKKSQKEREEASREIRKYTADNETIKEILRKEFNFADPTKNDIVRYRLYQELAQNAYKTLYSNVEIKREEIFSKKYDIEHIIPQSRFFDDSFANKTLELRDINIEKGNMTAYDYISKKWPERLEDYKNRVQSLQNDGVISKTKKKYLLMTQSEIPDDFISRDLRDSQYIAKKAKEMLESVVPYVVTTTGSITARLRDDWQLVDVMKDLNWDKYDKLGLTEVYRNRDGQEIRHIKDWTKRNDHRHHAMDALTIAFTKRAYIQYLNNLNARINNHEGQVVDLPLYDSYVLPTAERADVVMQIERAYLRRDHSGRMRFLPPIPLAEFRQEAKQHLDEVFVSIKAKNKVVTRNVNVSKRAGKGLHKVQLTPRGKLHEATIYGKIQQYNVVEVKVGINTNAEFIRTVADKKIRQALTRRLHEFGNDPKKAFTGKNSLAKNPLYIDDIKMDVVPEKVKVVTFEDRYTIRKPVDESLNVEEVVDVHIRHILEDRLESYGGNAKKAFSGLDENPIWLNRPKGIAIKRVTVFASVNPIALHDKRDRSGVLLCGENGMHMANDFVKPGYNHHVAIYRDTEGNLHEQIVTFIEAVARVNVGDPIICKDYRREDGWEFVFSMKQNEMFVFPDPKTGFDPSEIDLMDESNYSIISPYLFRVQKLASKYYNFRHHLDTSVDESKTLKDVTWKRITSLNNLKGVVKVRINHLGKIVQVGEY